MCLIFHVALTQGLISEDTFIERLHFAFFGYPECESELLGRQVGEQVITVEFEVCPDGGQWGESLLTQMGVWGDSRKMKLELSQS